MNRFEPVERFAPRTPPFSDGEPKPTMTFQEFIDMLSLMQTTGGRGGNALLQLMRAMTKAPKVEPMYMSERRDI